MKALMTTILAAGALLPAQARVFSPVALEGAAVGGVIGGIVGGHAHRYHGHYHQGFSGKGAAIGAGVGLLVGALADESHRAAYTKPSSYHDAPAPTVSLGYGYASCGSSAHDRTSRPQIPDAPRVPDAPTF